MDNPFKDVNLNFDNIAKLLRIKCLYIVLKLISNCQPFRSPWVLVGFLLLKLYFSTLCFVDNCLTFCPFSFGYYIFCPSSTYEIWFPLYIQTFLMPLKYINMCCNPFFERCKLLYKFGVIKWKTEGTTLSEQSHNPIEKQKVPHCRNNPTIQ